MSEQWNEAFIVFEKYNVTITEGTLLYITVDMSKDSKYGLVVSGTTPDAW
jgi:hypothetical protein